MIKLWKTAKILIYEYLLILACCTLIAVDGSSKQPNIVIIIADDLGFDDVSFRGSNEFLTPNIDALAYSGVILNRYYVPSLCTPSRAALMTGKNPIKTGLQHYVIPNYVPTGLPLSEKTLAQIFKDAGYYTCLIGKWHLGFAKKAYTPMLRGFDHHYGYLGAYVDYFDQTLYNKPYASGHDFRNNLNITRENQGEYVTDSLTKEAVKVISEHDITNPLFMVFSHLAPHSANEYDQLQAPEDEIQKFKYIPDVGRRIYAAMVSKMDESVGRVVNALDSKGILNDTIIIFYSDNGAPSRGMHENHGSNYPLRGQKNSPWEGGVRSSATLWSGRLQKNGVIWNQVMHPMDWLPTLAAASGITIDTSLDIDGHNLWDELIITAEPIARKLVHNIDDIFHYVSYLSDDWKYVNGTTLQGKYDYWITTRENDHQDPRASTYAEHVVQSRTWKALAQHLPQNLTIHDLDAIRRQAAISCRFSEPVSSCEPLLNECIFNIKNDPCEQENLIDKLPDDKILKQIRFEINEQRKVAKEPIINPQDPKSDPKFHEFEWTWWKDISN